MVANTIHHALRATDTVGRWGGEEFVVILYNVYDEKTLLSAAAKIRTLIAMSRLDIQDRGLSVTASIGMTCLYPNYTPDSLIRRADGLMYKSKHSVANRVTLG